VHSPPPDRPSGRGHQDPTHRTARANYGCLADFLQASTPMTRFGQLWGEVGRRGYLHNIDADGAPQDLRVPSDVAGDLVVTAAEASAHPTTPGNTKDDQ
jgi:hypothetical protein